MSRNSKAINITLPADLIKQIDTASDKNFASRSDFIRESIVLRLRGQRIVDEWGDEGNWETVVDFKDLPGGGMPIDEFIDRLEELNGQDQ